MSWTVYVALLMLAVMQSYALYPMSWKLAWRYIKGKFGV